MRTEQDVAAMGYPSLGEWFDRQMAPAPVEPKRLWEKKPRIVRAGRCKYAPRCPKCGKGGRLYREVEFYGRVYSEPGAVLWACMNCDTRVGCHAGTNNPLGSMADEPTRDARHSAHIAFDALWKKTSPHNCFKYRTDAYRWLADTLGLTPDECHIGLMNIEQCNLVVAAAITKKNEVKR